MDIYRKTSDVVRCLHPDSKTKKLEIKVAIFISPRGVSLVCKQVSESEPGEFLLVVSLMRIS